MIYCNRCYEKYMKKVAPCPATTLQMAIFPSALGNSWKISGEFYKEDLSF